MAPKLYNRITRRIKKTASIFLREKAFAPHNIALIVTHRCNLNCLMCWLHKKTPSNHKKHEPELSLNEICNLIDDVKRFKPVIEISGGEPFIREDILDIIKHIKESGLKCIIFTNGTLLNQEICKSLLNMNLDNINFSIDGLNKTHNKIRGEGTYNKAIKNIKLLSSLRKNKKLPIINLCTTISTQN